MINKIDEQIIFNKIKNDTMQDTSYAGKKEGYVNTEVSIDKSLKNVINYISDMEKHRSLTSYKSLISNRRHGARFAIFLKKIIRRLLFWYVEPICTQQTAYNNSVTPAIGNLVEAHMDLFQKLEHQRKEEIQRYEAAVAETGQLRQEIKSLEDRMKQSIEYNEKFRDIIDDITGSKLTDGAGIYYAQSGEDVIINYILRVMGINVEAANYLDLGANHAKEISNTYSFYQRGASGVLVEANPKLIPELKLYRSRDVIINKCIDVESGNLVKFYLLNGDGLSSDNEESIIEAQKINQALFLTDIVEVETIAVKDIIRQYFETAPVIMSVDLEGKELEILQQIDFDNWRPMIVILEMIEYQTTLFVGEKNQTLLEYMKDKEYTEYAFTGINSIFLDQRRF